MDNEPRFMKDLKIYKKIHLVNPACIIGWPGMGNVALGAIDYVLKKLNAEKFAEIRVDALTSLEHVSVEDGLASLPPPPRNVFYCTKNPDLVIFEGEAQLPAPAGIILLNKVLTVLSDLEVSRIYTGAALPLPVSHKEESQVFVSANKKPLLAQMKRFGLTPMDGGHIAGLNGLALGFAGERNIEAVCLLATIPQYAIGLPNPKAQCAIIDVLRKMLNFKIDLHELEEFAKEMDDKMAAMEDKIKDVLVIEKEEPEPRPDEKKIPGYIIEKIEKLFSEAKSDRSRAFILKKELDRWDLYKVYEDKFLDLFKESR